MRDRKFWRHEWRLPRIWKEALFKAQPGAKTWMLALLLLEEAENPYCPRYFKLPNKGLAALGIDRRAKWRALRNLQGMGLIVVDSNPGKSPRVKVMWRRRT
jgi:hypothetical protein